MTGSVPIHDKCYTFSTKVYHFPRYPANKYCKEGGKIPVPFSMSQTKFIAMEAHRKGINRMWMNVNNKGRTIEDSHVGQTGFLLFSNPWKVYEDQYWDGDVLKSNPNREDRGVEATAQYLFFRTRTDYEHNLVQGSFERTNKKAKASVVCEYQAKIVPKQGWYCDKMGPNGLGMNALYDNKKKRCLYTSLTAYSHKGDKNNMKDFPG
ncbi:hypothetical protein PFISCL1PPCAC_25930, partial [Pristionchus fissidentatus]